MVDENKRRKELGDRIVSAIDEAMPPSWARDRNIDPQIVKAIETAQKLQPHLMRDAVRERTQSAKTQTKNNASSN